ncbi:MAG: RluA family pseudouridine synthase [Clostridia bacterium]|nr:RluA family pseudouridine synthase [Clostridia bacterium]
MDILVDKDLAGLTVREYLTRRLGYSSAMIKKLKFSEGGILVNGSFVTVRYEMKEGDVLTLGVEDKEDDVSPYTVPVDIPIEVIYEDEYVTAVNKPAGMPAHPSHGHRDDTVSNALAFRYREKNYVFRPVNRLDRDTSGCMLTSNTRDASYKMYRAMTEGKIKKIYVAVADGKMAEGEGVWDKPIGRSPTSIITRRVDEDGKPSATRYRVIASQNEKSLLLVAPETGRTHQIRVHASDAGHPLTGDDLYGTLSPLIGRQALHCAATVFPHPKTGETVTVRAPLPDDMKNLIAGVFSGVDIDKELKEEPI